MEEVGRAVMPGPFLATVLLGGAAIAEAGSAAQRREWLPRIAAGEAKATLAVTEPNARWDAAGITATAREARGGFTLSGTKMFVRDAHLADVLVVAARSRDGSTMEDGVSLFLVPKDMPGLAITAAALDRRDAQIVRGEVRQCRGAGVRAARRVAPGLGAAAAGHRQRGCRLVGRDVRRARSGFST